MLENHSDFTAYIVDLFQVVRQLDIVDNDGALLMLFQTIDTSDERRLPGAGRPADNNTCSPHRPSGRYHEARGIARTTCSCR